MMIAIDEKPHNPFCCRDKYTVNPSDSNILLCTSCVPQCTLSASVKKIFSIKSSYPNLHPNQLGFRLLNNINTKLNKFSEDFMAWMFFEFQIARKAEARNKPTWEESFSTIDSRYYWRAFTEKRSGRYQLTRSFKAKIFQYYEWCFGEENKAYFSIEPYNDPHSTGVIIDFIFIYAIIINEYDIIFCSRWRAR